MEFAWMGTRAGIVAILSAAIFLSACNTSSPIAERRLNQFLGNKEAGAAAVEAPTPVGAQTAANQKQGSTPLGPEQPGSTGAGHPLTAPEILYGTGARVQGAPQRNPIVIDPDGAVALNFVNADIREVVDTILGTTMKVNYLLDPRVQGIVTMRTTQPVPREAVFGLLEDVLAVNGAAIVQDASVYKIVPIAEAAQTPPILSELEAPVRFDRGFGLYIIPLAFTSGRALQDVLEPFVPPGRVLRIDEQRNLVVFVGTSQEARDMENLVASFDVDWMAGQSFGLFPVRYANPETMVAELDKIFSQTEGGPLAGVVQFMPILRLNAILVITPQPLYLANARDWIARLDRGQEGDQRRLYVYYVQNGRAGELADLLGEIFDVSATTAGGDYGDLAPGLTPATVSRGPTVLSGSTTGGSSSGYGTGTGGFSTGSGGTPTADSGSSGTFEAMEGDVRGRTDRTAADLTITASLGATESEDDGKPKSVRIVADDRNNALVIYATGQEYEAIDAALQKLDIVPLQVLIEATILEVSLNDTLRYGVQWFFNSGDNSFTFSSLVTGAVSSLFPGFNYVFGSGDVDIVINALSQVTDVKVVSSPQLMVLDNEQARLQVGDEIPIVVRTSQSVTSDDPPIVSEIEYRDTGVILDIIPRVNASGLVTLDIVQEVSDVTATVSSGIDSPTIQQRRIASTVAISSGQTVALGGLIRDRNEVGETGIPLLGDIPVVGNLFKTTSDNVRRTELLVLLTPRVVRDSKDARSVTEELRKRLRALAPLDTRIQ
jgi:general secretion pathway protein D